MKVLILAGGYGTRLYPLVQNTPKPLLEIAQKPIINYLVDGIRMLPQLAEVIVVTNNKFAGHFEVWKKQLEKIPAPITIINDHTNTPQERLGSVGDIQFVLRQHSVDDDLLILGGDNIFDFVLKDFVQFAKTKTPHVSIGLFDIKNLEEAKKFGVVAIDQEGKVRSFEEKPPHPRSSLIAMCCYFLPKTSLPLVGIYLDQIGKADKAGDYIHWLTEKHGVYGFQFQGKWFDIGSIEAYHEAEAEFRKRNIRQAS
jgi:glucose-1-phosphate thymidylyltransferase